MVSPKTSGSRKNEAGQTIQLQNQNKNRIHINYNNTKHDFLFFLFLGCLNDLFASNFPMEPLASRAKVSIPTAREG